MTAIITPNSLTGDKSPDVPFKDDGEFYTHIMYFDQNSRIAYADSAEELIELLIPRYMEYDEENQTDLRVKYMLDIQKVIQQVIIGNLDEKTKESLKDWELKVLEGTYNKQDSFAIRDFWKENPEVDISSSNENDKVDVWSSDQPIVLIDAAYQPWTELMAPFGKPDGSNVIWLNAMDEIQFLDSLSELGIIAFGTEK